MESLSLKLAKIVGTPDERAWSQVYTFFPEEEEKEKKRGILLAVLSLTTGGDLGTVALGREVLLRLHEEYYGETHDPAMERLTSSIEKVCREFTNGEQQLEVTAAVFLDNILYLAISGLGQVWLKRQNIFSRVLEGEKAVPAGRQEKTQNASGFLQEDDLFVLGTAAFFPALGEGVFRAALEANEPNEAVEFLTPLIHRQESASRAAVLIGKVQKEVVEKLEEERHLFRHFLAWILAKVPRFSLGAIYIKRPEGERKNKRMFLAIAVVLISLLAISIFFGQKRRQESIQQQQFTQIYQEATALLRQGETLTLLNPLQSREILLQAKTKLGELEQLKTQVAKTEELKNQIETALSGVFKEYQLAEVPTFIDLTLITVEGRGERLALYQQSLVVLDREKNRIFGIDIKRKSAEVLVGGGAIANAKFLTIEGDWVYILEEEGLAQVGIKNKKTQRGKVKTETDWGEIVSIKAYGGNLYLLDRGKNQIWRYLATEAGFGSRQSWFKGVSPNLATAVSMAIDGSIWFLTSEGKILKFTQGAPSAFGIAGLNKPLSRPTIIYTDEEAESLYILDKGNSRIIVFAKSGEYQAEYNWPGIKDVTDMVVSESEKKIFLLGGSKIYEISLR